MANIMIVDDSTIIRQSLRSLLEGLGHHIAREAVNGKEALQFFQETKFDLITMDIEMPGINGIEVVRLMLEQDPQAAIVMISSVEDRGRVFEAIKLGAKHYFVKPFSADKVSEVINSVLGADEQQKGEERQLVGRLGREENPAHRMEPQAAPPREERSWHAPELDALPFELFHMDERTILIVRQPITDRNLTVWSDCLQGLLFFRKMKFVVEFWEPVRHEDGYRLLLDFISCIRARNGKIAAVTDDPGYYAQLLSELRDGVYRTYKEIKW